MHASHAQGGARNEAPRRTILSRITIELTGREGLAGLGPAWDALAAHAGEPNPFYERWMFLPSLSPDDATDLRCLLVWAEQERPETRLLAALVPLRRLRRFKGLPVTVLSSWTHPSWPLGTPLVRAGLEKETVRALLGWLDAGADGARAMEFRLLPTDGVFAGHLADALREHGRIVATDSCSRPLLRPAATAENYVARAISSASRKCLRRKERRLGELGRLEHVSLGMQEDPLPAIDEFLRLEASGWKARAGGALACRPETLRLARAALAHAHRLGRLQLVGLNLDGQPIARCCNLIAGEAAFAYRSAYDERFARYSPGVLAEIDTIRHFHATPGLAYMDSITDPGNLLLGQLWMHRRSLQSFLLGSGAIGELWVSTLPILKWTKRRVARQDPPIPIRAPGTATVFSVQREGPQDNR